MVSQAVMSMLSAYLSFVTLAAFPIFTFDISSGIFNVLQNQVEHTQKNNDSKIIGWNNLSVGMYNVSAKNLI